MIRRALTRRLCYGMAFIISSMAYAQDCGMAELIGDNLDLDTGETTNVGGVSAAYNSGDNEYRVVWFDSRIVGQNDVYAQRVSPSGELLGPNVTIIAGSNSQTDTAVAYDPTNNQYFITWRNQSDGPGSPGFNHAFGGLASATGGLIGSEFDVSNAGLEATLAYNSTNNEYFLEARNFAGGGTAGIYGRRVSSAGDLLGGSITIATAGAPAPAGQVAYNVNGNQYLATWRDQMAENLKGRIINADGSFGTSPFVISPMFPESGLAASVAFDPISDRYLVVFSEFSAGGVYGQFVTGSGSLDGETFTIFTSTSRLSPFAAYDEVNGVFLTAWVDSDRGAVSAQLLADDGSSLGGPLWIVGSGASGVPRVVTNSTEGGFIVAWVDRSNVPARADVLAQLVGVTAVCRGDIDGDCDTDLSDLAALLSAYGTSIGDPAYDPNADFDDDGDVDLTDLAYLLSDYGCTP
ncbi:MAG: hypothetical protein ACE5I3_11160 [Phycisphaerae bacterium]